MADPVRVAIDTSILALSDAGPATYTRELLGALGSASQVTLHSLAHRPRFSRSRRLLRIADTLHRELFWEPRTLPRLAVAAGADVLHGPAQSIPLRAHIPTVMTVYDAYIARAPRAFPAWQSRRSARTLPRMLHRADRVIAISDFTKAELLELFPSLDPRRIIVTPLAAARAFHPPREDRLHAVLTAYALARPYVIAVGRNEPRKNFDRVIRAFGAAAAETHDLVVVGSHGWRTTSVPELAARAGLAKRVRWIGHVPMSDLPALYAGADASVYAALYEGFGLPLLESMACGTPVVRARGSALDEVAGDDSIVVDATDIHSIAAGIALAVSDRALRTDLRRRGLDRSARFTWDRCALQTLAVYRAAREG